MEAWSMGVIDPFGREAGFAHQAEAVVASSASSHGVRCDSIKLWEESRYQQVCATSEQTLNRRFAKLIHY